MGFLISSFSLCFVYFIWLLEISNKSGFGPILFIILSVTFCTVIAENNLKIKNQKYIHLIVSFLTLFFIFCSFNLKETYPTKFENENLIVVEIKIIDKLKNPKFGDTIEVNIERQPLFGIRGIHEVYKTTTNEKGIAKIKLSKSNNYELFILSKENKFNSFGISTTDLKIKNEFLIEE